MELPDSTSATSAFRASELVGLLADADRRRVVAALILDATTLDELRAASGLDLRALTRALHRLVDAGLVVRSEHGEHWLLEDAFRAAARAEAARVPVADEHTDAPRAEAKVLRAFVRDGRIVAIPTVASKRRVILEWLVQQFEPGRRYSEAMVNLVIGKFHADTAAWRRYLVDEGFMSRERGEYWRSGGRVEV